MDLCFPDGFCVCSYTFDMSMCMYDMSREVLRLEKTTKHSQKMLLPEKKNVKIDSLNMNHSANELCPLPRNHAIRIKRTRHEALIFIELQQYAVNHESPAHESHTHGLD